MEMFSTRVLVAVVVAAVSGTLFNAAAVAIAVSPDRLALALVPGRYIVAIALCLALPFLSRLFDRLWFFISGVLWLTVAASVIAKLIFGVGAPWSMVLGFNLVYAIAAIITYHLITAKSVK
ncbi:MAG: hypothetical protein AAF299_02850 [Pseudomonadota bacterium]